MKRQRLRRRLRGLGELAEIMDAMKTLALMESQRLTRLHDNQRRVVAGIEQAAAQVCHCHGQWLARPRPEVGAVLLIGSERGFCGDFNEALLAALEDWDREGTARLLVVGSRLGSQLAEQDRLTLLPGALTADELPGVLGRCLESVLTLDGGHPPLGLTALFHDPDQHRVIGRRLLPTFTAWSQRPPPPGPPPRIHLPPRQLLQELADYYLFAALNELFHASLLAENQRRAEHLEGAFRRLEEKRDRLRRVDNRLRQEEITEEIEVLLLNSSLSEKNDLDHKHRDKS